MLISAMMLLSGVQRIFLLAGSFILFTLLAWVLGIRKGKKTAREEARQEFASILYHVQEKRHEIDSEIQDLASAQPQKIVDAAPDTAACKLLEDGWTRD
ncbi:hypothetical protein B488_07690 [Liberibacter crescens BT-1]|uniref:Uncharacterized protein n=2 Tax=Liberibacter crescens TaxID=1273132 RepID=L0EWK3_LIBCB|nr:hypothetical protein B488_07690 [Liberibacter crescens BT-1]